MQTKVIAVTSGKGGVGKSITSTNLAVILSKMKKQVLLLDADLNLANVHLLLGLTAKKNLSHFFNQECNLFDIIQKGPFGLNVISAASGETSLLDLSQKNQVELINGFNELNHQHLDYLIIDTPSGISDIVLNFNSAADEVLVVVCDEPTSIADSYALIKILNQTRAIKRFKILINMVKTQKESEQVFKKILNVTDKFLDVFIEHVGYVPIDHYLKRSVQLQSSILETYPGSVSCYAFKRLAEKLKVIGTYQQDKIKFFYEKNLCLGI